MELGKWAERMLARDWEWERPKVSPKVGVAAAVAMGLLPPGNVEERSDIEEGEEPPAAVMVLSSASVGRKLDAAAPPGVDAITVAASSLSALLGSWPLAWARVWAVICSASRACSTS